MVRKTITLALLILVGCGGGYAPRIEEALDKLKSDPNSRSAREHLISAGREALDSIINVLETEKPELRKASAEIIGEMKKRANEGEGVRYLLLGKRDSEKAGRALAEALFDSSFEVRKSSLIALRQFDLKDLLGPVILQLLEEDESVAEEALKTIASAPAYAVEYLIVRKPDRRTDKTSCSDEEWEEIKNRLASQNEIVRANTIKNSMGLTDSRFLEALLILLEEDSVAEVRACSAWALEYFDGSKTNSALQKALEDESPLVVLSSARVLAKRGNRKSQRLLRRVQQAIKICRSELIARSKDKKLGESKRVNCVLALGKIPDSKLVSEIDELADSSTEPSVKVRRVAVTVIAEELDPASRGVLRKALRDDDELVRLKSAEALARLGETDAVDFLVELLRSSEEATTSVRVPAAEALGKAGKSALDYLLKKISDRDPMVRWGVVSALGEIGHRRAVPALVKALEDENADVRSASAEALGKIADPESAEVLARALADPNERVRWFARLALERIETPALPSLLSTIQSEKVSLDAIDLIGTFGGKVELEKLKALLDSDDPVLVARTATAIGRILSRTSDGEQLARALRRVLGKIPELASDEEVRAWAEARRASAVALGYLGEGVALLRAVCLDPDHSVRIAGLIGLERINRKPLTIVDCLGYALRSKDQELRRSAVRKLAESGSLNAVPYLEDAVDNPDEVVRKVATEALLTLTGQTNRER